MYSAHKFISGDKRSLVEYIIREQRKKNHKTARKYKELSKSVTWNAKLLCDAIRRWEWAFIQSTMSNPRAEFED